MGKEADILAKIVVVEDDVYMREELLNLLEKRKKAVATQTGFHAPILFRRL